MKKTLLTQIISFSCLLGLTGCSREAIQLVSIASDVALSQTKLGTISSNTFGGIETGPVARLGAAQGALAGMQTQANFGTLGVMAISQIVERKHIEENKIAFEKTKTIMQDPDKFASEQTKIAIEQYNKEHGTNFTTIEEIRQSIQKNNQ